MNIFGIFDTEQLHILKSIKNICIYKNIMVYVVGGAVRDAILGMKVKDIDISLDEDPQKIIKNIGQIQRVSYHERFQTASIKFENGVQIDLIRCRKEIYERPGALPEIIPSNIENDIFRRDFTMNALAYDLINDSIIDIYGGIADIENKLIRKIHEDSYSEDPTRIFRAIKYSVRYGFQLYDRVEIEKCIGKNVFSTISSDRIVKEIYLLCGEKKWRQNFELCRQLNILPLKSYYLGKLNPMKNYIDINMRYLNVFYSIDNDKYRNIMANNSVIPSELKKSMLYLMKNQFHMEMLLENSKDNYVIFNLLHGLDDYILAYFSWNIKLIYKIYNYVCNMEYCKLELKGNDLKKMGIKEGKCIGKILKCMMRIKLNTGIEKIFGKGKIKKCL